MTTDLAAFSGSDLCIVGNVNRDLRLAAIVPTQTLFQDGETPTAAIRETLGGGGANSAIAAAGLGASVSFVGKIGGDGLGHRINRTLADQNIKTHLARDASIPTGTSVNLVWTTGHRHFVSCLPNATSLKFDDIDLSAMKAHRHLLRADVWFSEQMLFDGGNRKLFEFAKKAGIVVSLDVNADPWASAERREALRGVLSLVDLIHGNVGELCTFTSTHSLDAALQAIERVGARAVVVHMGSEGAGFYQNGQLIVEPSAPLRATPVNTTGTGDMLSVCMMLLHAREDMDARERLKISNAVVADYMAGDLNLKSALSD